MYNYDNRGNILTVSKSGVLFQQYVYDEASQVKAEYNYAEKTAMTYVYDSNGNIVSKTPYTNVTNSDLSTATQGTAIVYGYGDSNWSDKLTSYDGQTISYDASGNPTSYRGETVTWNGRLMTSFTKDDRRYEYSYNSDGMRTVKKVYKNNELVYTYTYIWDGDVLLGGRMEVTDADEPITIRYLYDDSGELYGMDYNGNGYYGFIKNLQGDIVSIVPLDSESNVELNIEYDAWGKPIFEDSSLGASFVKAMIMAATNVGYRGYFYDFETGLYYLRSRYYDPEIGRFINADDTAYLGYDASPLSMNIFAYCENNPVNREDDGGQAALTIVSIAVTYVAVKYVLSGLIVAVTIAVLKKAGVLDALINSFSTLIRVVGTVAMSAVVSLKQAINEASKKAQNRKPNSKREIHHIIPQKKKDAKTAYDIWVTKCRLSINDSRNKVSISYNLHKHLHTTAYCNAINSLVSSAFKKNGSRGVINAVLFAKCLLTVATYGIK